MFKPRATRSPARRSQACPERFEGQRLRAVRQEVDSIAEMIGGTFAVAFSRLAKISSRLISASSPQPAAQLATSERQA